MYNCLNLLGDLLVDLLAVFPHTHTFSLQSIFFFFWRQILVKKCISTVAPGVCSWRCRNNLYKWS